MTRAEHDRSGPVRLGLAIITVSDMARAVSFYRDTVGLEIRFESADWTEFATEGATLALHRVHPGTATGAGLAGRCRPGLRVTDLDAFHEIMMARSVVCTQVPTLVFGARVAQYMDPDGLPFSVSEGT